MIQQLFGWEVVKRLAFKAPKVNAFIIGFFLVVILCDDFLIYYAIMQAHVFKSGSGACAAFLANYNPSSYAKVAYGNNHYNLPPWSISILPDCKNTVYNTARVRKASVNFFV